MDKILLEPGNFYHIHNRGNNGQKIFFEPENYLFFLHRYHQYIYPFGETIAWVLLRNQFHFLIYVRPNDEVLLDKVEYRATEIPKRIDVHLQFGHFFNSYAKAINKRYNRTGSLFEKNFNRKLVPDFAFKPLILYIHYNPVKDGLCENLSDYRWSSYESILSDRTTSLNREFVLKLFKNRDEFKLFHLNQPDENALGDLIF
jgi:putative transposase